MNERCRISGLIAFLLAGIVVSEIGCRRLISSTTNSAAPCTKDGAVACAGACKDVRTDAANCGRCGRSCLGGACEAGVCQPIALGSTAGGYARETYVSGSKLYVQYETLGRGAGVYQMDANRPSAPAAARGIPNVNAYYSCIIGDRLYWSGSGAQAHTIQACGISDCEGTTAAVVTGATGVWRVGPVCDRVTNELVWVMHNSTSPTAATVNTIFRASSTGANTRRITSFTFDNDGANWSIMNETGRFSNHRAERLFFQRRPPSPASVSTLYSISTVARNAGPLVVATYPGAIGGGMSSVVCNDTTVIGSTYDSQGHPTGVFSVPLPGGTRSGAPSSWFSGTIDSGVADATYFYGVTTSAPNVPRGAVFRCALSTPCDHPTVLFRGHDDAYYFAQDATAIYWTTAHVSAGQGFTVWKAAK